MNIGIYDTYFESEGIGGGERYMLTAAVHWAKKHSVSVITDNASLLKISGERFGLATENLRLVPNIFKDKNIVRKACETKKYDVLFYLTDGSIPTSLAKHNIMQVQMPFPKLPLTFLKSAGLSKVVCNSEFTQDNLDSRVRSKCIVIYPPVDVGAYHAKTKERIILSVGRFNPAKKQNVLIDVFGDLLKTKKMEGWRLILAGGVMKSDEAYLDSLKKLAKGLPIEFCENIPLAKMVELYAHASFYWHAAGFGETNPMNMEHFGISTVEAMASKCIPLVYAGGGQPEIVQNRENGYLWKTPTELVEKTEAHISQKDTDALRRRARSRAEVFSTDRFGQALDLLLASL